MPISRRYRMPTELPGDVLFTDALQFCCRVHSVSPDEALHCLESGHRKFHSSFRYGLAKGLSTYLGSLGCVVQEVYVYGSTMDGEAHLASDIDVLLVVRKGRDELKRLLGLLDISLASWYRQLIGLKMNPASLLDVHLLEGSEIAERSGNGIALTGWNTRPVCLWRSPVGRRVGASCRERPPFSSQFTAAAAPR